MQEPIQLGLNWGFEVESKVQAQEWNLLENIPGSHIFPKQSSVKRKRWTLLISRSKEVESGIDQNVNDILAHKWNFIGFYGSH